MCVRACSLGEKKGVRVCYITGTVHAWPDQVMVWEFLIDIGATAKYFMDTIFPPKKSLSATRISKRMKTAIERRFFPGQRSGDVWSSEPRRRFGLALLWFVFGKDRLNKQSVFDDAEAQWLVDVVEHGKYSTGCLFFGCVYLVMVTRGETICRGTQTRFQCTSLLKTRGSGRIRVLGCFRRTPGYQFLPLATTLAFSRHSRPRTRKRRVKKPLTTRMHAKVCTLAFAAGWCICMLDLFF